MSDLILEIGCEELPANAIASSLEQLQSLFTNAFADNNLSDTVSTNVTVYGTPRRLILHASGILAQQPDKVLELKGPPESVALDANGMPTPAGRGFAKKAGVSVDALTFTNGYAFATVPLAGRSARDVAAEILPAIIRQITFPKSMRWGANKLRFARPIRWILALIDDQVVPFKIENVVSGRLTRGHRFLAPAEVEVDHTSDFFSILNDAYVMYDQTARRDSILAQLSQLSEGLGVVHVLEALLDENVFLTEYPTAILGSFSPDYLSLPEAVLTTAMHKHQRYFPVHDSTNGSILPHFVGIRNGGGEYVDTVREGFESVLAARFADAMFFFDIDQRSALSEKIPATKTIVFQDKLGTVFDKTQRLHDLITTSGLLDGLTDASENAILDAALLCKADLATEMVKELPSLQGIVGENYALLEGKPESVARAIAEHYLPKTSGGPAPSTIEGSILAVADRLDTLTGYVGIGILPSGTSDPFALRRAASGLVAVMATSPAIRDVKRLFSAAWNGYVAQGVSLSLEKNEAYSAFSILLSQRLDQLLDDMSVGHDIRSAVLSRPVYCVHDVVSQAQALQSMVDLPALRDAIFVATRVSSILKSAELKNFADDTAPDIALFSDPAEAALWSTWMEASNRIGPAIRDHQWDKAIEVIAGTRTAVDSFFGSVKVMDEDLTYRENRLRMLQQIRNGCRQFADLEKIAQP